MSSLSFAEAIALQAASNALLTEIRDLSVRVAAVLPLVQEFRATVASIPPCPANVGNNIVRTDSGSACRSLRTIKVSQ
jgi:hypothetical protein